jgi:hypothetical protein
VISRAATIRAGGLTSGLDLEVLTSIAPVARCSRSIRRAGPDRPEADRENGAQPLWPEITAPIDELVRPADMRSRHPAGTPWTKTRGFCQRSDPATTPSSVTVAVTRNAWIPGGRIEHLIEPDRPPDPR